MHQNFRVMGLWRDPLARAGFTVPERTFLITLGSSREACLHRLDVALRDYSLEDIARFESIWLEEFDPGTSLRPADWIPIEELPIPSVRTSDVQGTPAKKDQMFRRHLRSRRAAARRLAKTMALTGQPQGPHLLTVANINEQHCDTENTCLIAAG